jgi:hypothetical protein
MYLNFTYVYVCTYDNTARQSLNPGGTRTQVLPVRVQSPKPPSRASRATKNLHAAAIANSEQQLG